MALVEPFAALRPRPELAAQVAALPYDVLSSAEARELAAGNPLSFLRVTKPEIDLPPGTDEHAPEVYARGRLNLDRLRAEGVLVADARPGFYVYRLEMEGRSQTGLVGVFSCEDYEEGVIRRHELTRPDKELDRTRHIEVLDAQTGPAFLIHPESAGVTARVAAVVSGAPVVDFRAADGVRHQVWAVFDGAWQAALRREFAALPRLYIADGHHRSAAAHRVNRARGGRGGSDRFLAVAFPKDQVCILAYHRVLRLREGLTSARLRAHLGSVGTLTPAPDGATSGPGRVRVYVEGRWWELVFRQELTGAGGAVDRLDVSVLQRAVLSPVFGIDDPRTSAAIAFVGGVRGWGALERMVDGGAWGCAFSMWPTGMDALLEVADRGEIMPPKSTWFEPKLRDGLFSHGLT